MTGSVQQGGFVQSQHDSRVLAVNFHVIKACDARCDFCYATFRNLVGRLKSCELLPP